MMKVFLVAALLLQALPVWAAHAMTQAEFRQVLHERDAAWARAWAAAQRQEEIDTAQRQLLFSFAWDVTMVKGDSPEITRQHEALIADMEKTRGETDCPEFVVWVQHAMVVKKIRLHWKTKIARAK